MLMSFCLFVSYASGADPAARISPEDRARLVERLRACRGFERIHIYTPAAAHDPFLNDGAPPRLVLQFYFARISDLELATARTGPLQVLASDFPSLNGAPITHEAMVVRRFAVPDPVVLREPWCTYLVSYEGPAEDPPTWHEHYFAHHVPLMAKLTGIRELEVYTGLDCAHLLPGKRVRHLQRNKVAFDSPAALNASLQSALRAEMRADYERFPSFTGTVTHYPMATVALRP